MIKKKTSNFRYERKYVIPVYERFVIDQFIKFSHYGFKEIFKKRFINNIYFDSFNLQSYNDCLEGLADRKKIRIRWYNDNAFLAKNPSLEFKIKKGHVGKKESYIFDNLDIKDFFLKNQILKKLKKTKYLSEYLDFIQYQPVLMNRYERQYFLSNDGSLRVTLDYNVEYYSISNFLENRKPKYKDINNIILEIKYSVDSELNQYNVGNNLLSRLSRNSKYVNGINKIKN